MTQYLGSFGLTQPLAAQDERVRLIMDQWSYCGRRLDPWRDGALWPGSRGLGENFWIFGLDALDLPRWGCDDIDESGGQQRRKIIGQTLDAVGVALGSCTVKGFVTAGDIFVGQVVSDTGGYYELCTAYTGAHYLTCYKGGSPDLSGSTVNTLIPV